MGPMYRFPRLYDLVLKILHGKELKKRYQLIAREVGEDQRVFEPGCGTCLVVPHLRNGCTYEGWDLNDTFVEFNRKKKIAVRKRDIFDFEHYPENDVTIICDVLHHIAPDHVRLIKGARKRTKKLIVSEPARSFKPPRSLQPFYLFLQKTIGDYDGINPADCLLRWDYRGEKLRQFYRDLGCAKTIDVGWDMIAVLDGTHEA
jgi:hypothetical protein